MTEKPNIVLITMDTTRAKNINCYGSECNHTPFIDQMAKKGKKIEKCISQCNWTLPSHAALMSGQYPHEIDCMTMNDKFEYTQNIANKLGNKGYRTIGVTNVGFLDPQFGFDRGFDFYRNLKSLPFEKGEVWKIINNKSWETTNQKYLNFVKECVKRRSTKELINGVFFKFKNQLQLGDQGADRTNSLAKRELEKSDGTPFFLFLNFIEPHAPYRPPQNWRRELTDLSWRTAQMYDEYDELAVLSGQENISQEELLKMESLYDAEIAYLDSKISELYHWMSDNGYLENTVFIITSDHGEYFGEHGLYKHLGNLYQENIHVPLIINDTRTKNQTDVEQLVELKSLYDYMIRGCDTVKKTSEATSVYSGIKSHFRSNKNLTNIGDFDQYGPKVATVTPTEKTIFSKDAVNHYHLEEFRTEKESGSNKQKSSPIDLSELRRSSQEQTEYSEEVITQLKNLGYYN